MLCPTRGARERATLDSMHQITVLTGAGRHRRRRGERQAILSAAFARSASLAAVARRHDVATSLISKWRQHALSTNHGEPSFALALRLADPPPSPVKGAPEDGTVMRAAWSVGTRLGPKLQVWHVQPFANMAPSLSPEIGHPAGKARYDCTQCGYSCLPASWFGVCVKRATDLSLVENSAIGSGGIN